MLNFESEDLREALSKLIKIGEVSSVDFEKGTARVVFDDDDSIVSYDLQVLHRNTMKNKDFAMPDIGEDVVCLFLPSGEEEGFILGSVYAGEILPPENSGAKRTVVFADDTRISYDREAHQLDIAIGATAITANAENVVVNTPANVNVEAAGSATIKAPAITIEGNVEIKGDVSLNGAMTTTGDVVSGAISLQNHTHTGNLGAPTSPPLP